MTGRELIKIILDGNLLDNNVVIWHIEKGRMKICKVEAYDDPERGEIEIITDGKPD